MSEGPRDRTQNGTITQDSKDTFELLETRSALPPFDLSCTGLIPQKPTLEGLATEMQLHLLHHVPNMTSLKALIRAVPAYHSAYDLERCAILRSVLINGHGSEAHIRALPRQEIFNLAKNHARLEITT